MNQQQVNECYERWRQEELEGRENALTALREVCSKLDTLAIPKVDVYYDGSGDAGCVETVHFYDSKEVLIDTPDDQLEAVSEQIEMALYRFLPCGWDINEGSFGNFILDVPDRKLRLEHSTRYVDTDYSESEVQL